MRISWLLNGVGGGGVIVVSDGQLRAATGRAPADRLLRVEAFYVGLLVFVGLFVTWFAGYVVYKLYQGQT